MNILVVDGGFLSKNVVGKVINELGNWITL